MSSLAFLHKDLLLCSPPNSTVSCRRRAYRSLENKAFHRIEDLMKAGWEGDSIFVVSDRLMADKKCEEQAFRSCCHGHTRRTWTRPKARDLEGNLLKNLHEGLRSPIDGRNSVPRLHRLFLSILRLALAPSARALAGLSKLIPSW